MLPVKIPDVSKDLTQLDEILMSGAYLQACKFVQNLMEVSVITKAISFLYLATFRNSLLYYTGILNIFPL